jgi:NAD(P)-dependent dehydrogenase (short-subunit alcohol dehydrogenase family)
MAYAEAALEAGDRVVLTARRVEPLRAWAAGHERVLVLPLDVTDPEQVRSAGFADEPVEETIPDYKPMLYEVRGAMIDQDGNQPGDPKRGVRAVLAAMAQDRPPHRLVLGSGAFDVVAATLDHTLADVRASESLSRLADYPA